MAFQLDNRRIAKNTLILYLRMFFLLIVGLYTGRVVLKVLGVVDYGVYNIAGGIIFMLYQIMTSMTATSGRFIQIELGRGNEKSIQRIFGNILFIHHILAGIILILGETVGLWFLVEKIVIPEDRFWAAFWVYQFSVMSAALTINCAPYNALIISHEKMSAFAYISIYDALMKLTIIYFVSVSGLDKLILYSFLAFCVGISDWIVYVYYCKRNFKESHAKMLFEKKLSRNMLSFAGWIGMEGFATILNTQGLNILLNMFFGPIINAARGVAVMIEGQVNSFYYNILQAFGPQMKKIYANSDFDTERKLLIRSSKFSFYAFYMIALPVILEIGTFLNWWLVEVPPYTNSFVILILLVSGINVLGGPLHEIVNADGHVKNYTLISAFALLFVLPVSYIFLRITPNPIIPFVILFVFQGVAQIIKICIALPMVGMHIFTYWAKVIFPIITVIIVSLLPSMALKWILPESFLSFVGVSISSFLFVILSSVIFGCGQEEKYFLLSMIKNLRSRCIVL